MEGINPENKFNSEVSAYVISTSPFCIGINSFKARLSKYFSSNSTKNNKSTASPYPIFNTLYGAEPFGLSLDYSSGNKLDSIGLKIHLTIPSTTSSI